MKKLAYAIAVSLAFLSATSASRAIATSPSGLLTTSGSPAIRHIDSVAQQVQPSSKPVVPSLMPSLTTQATTPVSSAAETTCKGDAALAKPPIPNNPTHIRNVVWRNMRAMCLQQVTQKPGNPQPADQR